MQHQFSALTRQGEMLAALSAQIGDMQHTLRLATKEQLRRILHDAPNDAQPHVRALTSCLCTQSHFTSPAYRRWCARLGETPQLHRKQWEYFFVCQAFEERGCLEPGARGLGFAVGQEPLPALFAGLGCEIVASDQAAENATAQGWTESNEYAGGLGVLNRRGLCDAEHFERLASFRRVDMNHVPRDLRGFDFVWSCCALEHLGSIGAGSRFMLESMKCLKPGGVAVHTTEFNVSSNDQTVDQGGTVLFRRRDMEAIASALADDGHRVEPIDFDTGDGLADGFIDVPPYKHDPHLKLQIGRFTSTSLGLIIRKEPRWPPGRTCSFS